MTIRNPSVSMALSMLIVLQLTMLFSLFTQTPPHPPLAVPPFALGPFLGASLALAIAAIIPGSIDSGAEKIMVLLATATSLVSFGPQKWLDPAIPQIWPAVLLGQIAAIVLIYQVFSVRRSRTVTG